MSPRPRILFAGGGTGGHLYPGLALAEAFQARPEGAEIFFIGAQRGVEARVLPERGVPHELLRLEPIRRSRIWENWKLVPALWSVVWGIPRIFSAFQPDLVVGTGGYASGPVVAWALLRGIPTAIQEQNSYPGLTTRLLAGRVRQLHLAFPEALKHMEPGEQTEIFELGNPIQPPDSSIDPEHARLHFDLGEGPVALVVGGSQGAKPINDALLRDLEDLGSISPTDRGNLQLLWATGPRNYGPIAEELDRLGVTEWVKAVPYIHDMGSALAIADMAISRAGAMAIAELCAWGIPSILVPFPHAAANHQHHNAAALDESDAAVMVVESELEPGRLWSELMKLARDPARRAALAARASERGHPDAATEIVDELVRLVPQGTGVMA